jgi:hypothetical protein
MSEIVKNEEKITEVLLWFKRAGKRYEESSIEYHALKLTSAAKCQFEKIIVREVGKNSITYEIVATGTKQKLLLLKFTMESWVQGAKFIPKFKD